MELPEQVIRIDAGESRETLLARLEDTTARRVMLRVTREATVPRAIEDFQALKSLARRRNLHLRIVSPVASVVGLAKIYDIEAEFDATVGKTGALSQPAGPSPPGLRPPLTPLPPAPTRAGSPGTQPSPPSENDWLFGGLDVDTIESDFAAERGRSAAPPSDVGAGSAGRAAPRPGPPAGFTAPPSVAAPPALPVPPPARQPARGDSEGLRGEPDRGTIEGASTAGRGRGPTAPLDIQPGGPTPPPAPPRQEPPAPGPVAPSAAAPGPPGGLRPHQPGTHNAARDPLQDSQFLPDWLRAAPPAPEPAPMPPAPPPAPRAAAAPAPAPASGPPALFAHGTATKPGPRWVVPCPHCGEPMDLELLIQRADYQD